VQINRYAITISITGLDIQKLSTFDTLPHSADDGIAGWASDSVFFTFNIFWLATARILRNWRRSLGHSAARLCRCWWQGPLFATCVIRTSSISTFCFTWQRSVPTSATLQWSFSPICTTCHHFTTLFCCANFSSTHSLYSPVLLTGWTRDIARTAQSHDKRLAASLLAACRPIARSVKRNLHANAASSTICIATCGRCWNVKANITCWRI